MLGHWWPFVFHLLRDTRQSAVVRLLHYHLLKQNKCLIDPLPHLTPPSFPSQHSNQGAHTHTHTHTILTQRAKKSRLVRLTALILSCSTLSSTSIVGQTIPTVATVQHNRFCCFSSFLRPLWAVSGPAVRRLVARTGRAITGLLIGLVCSVNGGLLKVPWQHYFPFPLQNVAGRFQKCSGSVQTHTHTHTQIQATPTNSITHTRLERSINPFSSLCWPAHYRTTLP